MFMSEFGTNSPRLRLIVHGPRPTLQPGSVFGIAKVMVFVSAFEFAAAIASRKLQSPTAQVPLVSAVLVTTSDAGGLSSLTIVRVAVDGAPSVAPVGLDSVRLTVSSGSKVVLPCTVTVNVLSVP